MKIEDVLNAYPSRLGEAEVTDSDKLRDLREWAESATSMLCELKNEAQDVDDGMAALIAERDQLRKMHDGVSADLDRERREHQEAMAEAAARELKLTEERDALQRGIEHSDRRGGDLERQLNHFVAQRDAEVEALRIGFMKERDKALEEMMQKRDAVIRDAEFFKSEAEKVVADLAEVSAALDKAGVPRSVDSMGNMITPAGRVTLLIALHKRLAPPKRRSKPKTMKKPKATAKRSRRKS